MPQSYKVAVMLPDEVCIDYIIALIKNKTAGIDIKFAPLPEFALEIINDGGLLNHIKRGKGPGEKSKGKK